MQTHSGISSIQNDKRPASPAERLASAWQCYNHQQWAQAADACAGLLAEASFQDEVHHLLGLIRWRQGRMAKALKHLRQAVACQPGRALYHNSLGVVLNETGAYELAVESLKNALRVSPENPDARCNLGLSYFYQHQLDRAAQCFSELLKKRSNHGPAQANLGLIHLTQAKMTEAAAAYEKALAIDPRQPRWWGNLGAAYLALGRFKDAAGAFRAAIKVDKCNLSSHVHLGVALRAMGDLAGSRSILEKARELAPEDGSVIANLAVVNQYTCQWEQLTRLYPRLDRNTRRALDEDALPDEQPLLNIRRIADLAINQAVARAWSRNAEQRVQQIGNRFTHRPLKANNGRITIGYLSYDFRDHPVAHQILPLFRLHDRRRLKILAFSMGPDDGSIYRRRIRDACDEFIDINETSLLQAAEVIYARKTDILVDLMGHTHHNRMGILALRPAPVQIGYLGFLGTTGADFIDYLVADPVVVPPPHTEFYDEKMIWMPHCYQLNHRAFLPGDASAKRSDWHLPEKGFVFCCFNQLYKIDADLFAAWMRVLKRVPRSVLWLYGDNLAAIDNLRAAAVNSGVQPDRLVFAPKVPLEEHIKRSRLANLALDTITYNGGATTANALKAGIPILTVLGRHWVSRMSASHLLAIGMPEMVASDLENYTDMAVALARSPQTLSLTRKKLAANSATHPLFDDASFVHSFETGLQGAWQRHLDGLPPAHIRLPARGNHG